MGDARRCADHDLIYTEDAIVSYKIKRVTPDGKVVLDENEGPTTEDIHETYLYCYDCNEIITIDRVVDADTWEVSYE